MRGQKYGVLICGDIAVHGGFDEFWNDVVLMREILLKNGFLPQNIFVLYGDGVDFSHPSRTNPRYIPSTPITDFAATTGNVQLVLNGLATGDPAHDIPRMTADDFLYVWTFDHGSTGGGHSYLCLRDGNMLDTDFSGLLDGISYSYRAIAMQQCFSGGFIPHLSNSRTVILTACAANEVAWPADDSPVTENEVYGGVTYHHGEFNFHLFSALAWEKIDFTNVAVDATLDRWASLEEVYGFITANDTRVETTQYDDGPGNIGSWMNLERDVFVFLRDNTTDTGQTPSSGTWWASPDLWVRNLDDGGTTHQSPIAGSDNYLHARLRNHGLVRSGPVTVKFFCAGWAGTEFVYPDDYSNLVTWASVEGVPAGSEIIVKGPWIASETAAAPGHPCLLAEVYEHSGVPSAHDHVWESNHLAQKNLCMLTATPGQMVKIPIVVGSDVVNQLGPMLDIELLVGEQDLETWLEIKDIRWLELLEKRRIETRRPVALTVAGEAHLRMDVTASEGLQAPGESFELNLAEGSQIYMGGRETPPFEGRLDVRQPLDEIWRSGRVNLDLANPQPVPLPPLIKTRQTLFLGIRVPERARPRTTYLFDVMRKDRRRRTAGGVRVQLQVRG